MVILLNFDYAAVIISFEIFSAMRMRMRFPPLSDLLANIKSNLDDWKSTLTGNIDIGNLSGLNDEINKNKMKVINAVNSVRTLIKNKIIFIHFGVLAVSAILALLLGYIRGFCSKPCSLQAEAAATLIRVSSQFSFILTALPFILYAALL